jgi:hypothetical protein
MGQAARTHVVEHYDLAATLPTHFRLASHVLGRDVLVRPPVQDEVQHDFRVARRA